MLGNLNAGYSCQYKSCSFTKWYRVSRGPVSQKFSSIDTKYLSKKSHLYCQPDFILKKTGLKFTCYFTFKEAFPIFLAVTGVDKIWKDIKTDSSWPVWKQVCSLGFSDKTSFFFPSENEWPILWNMKRTEISWKGTVGQKKFITETFIFFKLFSLWKNASFH